MTPRYLTTGRGQVRVWTGGAGPVLIALAGPTRTAEVVLAQLRAAMPDRYVVAVEPPGMGGSAGIGTTSAAEAGAIVAEALSFLGDRPVQLVAFELAAALVPALREGLEVTAVALVGADSAVDWTRHGVMPPPPEARDDGTHLNALWSFLRDRRLVRADDPALPIASGDPLPDTAELSATFVAATTSLDGFTRLWSLATAGLPDALAALPDAVRVGTLAELVAALPAPAASAGPPALPETAPAAGVEIWHQFLDTALGRAHLRRAGATGRPVLVLPTGGGSSAQFAPVLQGLAATRTAVALDYFGNGWSEPRDRVPDIADLAREAFAVADALGWDGFDVWGSHTGACVALEMTIMAPERIGRGVYEAPVMVTPEFRDDLLANYFPDLAPDRFGLHLQLVWNWRRDMFLYWPWYRVEHAATRAIGIPSAADLQLYNVGILESGTTYDLAYRAGFGYDTRSRLPLLRRPAILTAGPHDMLANALDDAASLVPDDLLQIVPTPETVWWPDPEPDAAEQTMRIYREFLG